MSLKTLTDLKHNDGSMESELLIDELRQEAIKWIKEIQSILDCDDETVKGFFNKVKSRRDRI